MCSLLLCGRTAVAQDSFNVETFEAGPSTTSALGVESTAVPGHLKPTADAVLHRSESPVVFRDGDLVEAIDNRWTLDLGLSLGLWSDIQLDARLPLVTTQNGVGLGGELDGLSAGDLRLRGKWRLLERDLEHPVGFAVQAGLYVPTGDSGGYTSDGVVRFEPRLVMDAKLGPVLLMFNAGYQIRPTRVVGTYRHDDTIRWGAAGRLPLPAGFDVEASLFGENSLYRATINGVRPVNEFAHPVETLGGVGWSVRGFRASIAAGAGLTRGVGAPAYRVVMGLAYSPFKPEEETAGRTVVAHDFDGDGFAGDADDCPFAAETFDGFEDLDGCPDLDDDGDSVADVVDLCPLEPGTVAKSGCPAVDVDSDGIDDASDACPWQPGTARSDGCPEPRDSPAWRSNFVVMSAGDCDPGDTDCTASTKDIVEALPEAVFFPSGRDRFEPDEHPLLEVIANRMREDSTIVTLRVEGHTDSNGDADFNVELSRGRAETVRDVLIRRGIDPSRLEVVPHGEEEPLDSNDTPLGRARNRRVAFSMTIRRRGRDEQVADVAKAVELPTLTIADFEFDRRMLVGFRPPRFVEGTVLRAPAGWLCSVGGEEPAPELTLLTIGPPVLKGLRYPGWTSEQRLTCRQSRNVIAFEVEVEIPPFGVRGVWAGGVQTTTRRPTQIDLRFAGRAMPLDVGIEGYELEMVAVSADVLRLRLQSNGRPSGSAARLGAARRVLLNVPLLRAEDTITVEPIPQQRRFIEIGGGATVLATGRTFARPGQLGGSAVPAVRVTARALATNWFALGMLLDIGSTLGPDPILFTPGIGGEAVFHVPIRLFRPFISTGLQTFFPGLDEARPGWENAIGVDYEPAAGAGLRASVRGTILTADGQLHLLPGGFLGAYTTF